VSALGSSLPKLPYRQSSNVAERDARRPKAQASRGFQRQKPVVPWRSCADWRTCGLRREGKCKAVYCLTAWEFEAKAAGGRLKEKG